MAKVKDVLNHIYPEGGWALLGDSFSGIEFIEAAPITKKEFDKIAAEYEASIKADMEAKAIAKQAVLDKLGLTESELQAALS